MVDIKQVDEIVPVLQILMSDLSPEDQAIAVNRALPSLVVLPSRSINLRDHLEGLHQSITGSLSYIDGSSGVGALGAMKVNELLRDSDNRLRHIINKLYR